jgi:hypothetical protein
MQEECYDIIGSSVGRWRDGLPDEEFGHAKSCPVCAASLQVAYGSSVEEMNALWRSKEPERKARELFQKDCIAWYETIRGKIYTYCGGPFWSRRAKWLGIPQWENYQPKA